MHENEISHAIMGAAIEVHREVAPGNIESSTANAFSQPFAQRMVKNIGSKIIIEYMIVFSDSGAKRSPSKLNHDCARFS